jgi:hypothetical protein
MRLSRSLTSRICRVLIGVMLFAQFAISAYACPGFTPRSVSASAAMTMPMAMRQDGATVSDKAAGGCDQMDSSAPNLCLEHCRAGHQSSDTAPASVAIAAAPALLYALPTGSAALASASSALPATDPPLASAAPPHAILHCVLRI